MPDRSQDRLKKTSFSFFGQIFFTVFSRFLPPLPLPGNKNSKKKKKKNSKFTFQELLVSFDANFLVVLGLGSTLGTTFSPNLLGLITTINLGYFCCLLEGI
jgi:hypothetical protein